MTGTKCAAKRDVRLIESSKGSEERQGPTLGVRSTEVSVKRESTTIPKSKTVYTSVFFVFFFVLLLD